MTNQTPTAPVNEDRVAALREALMAGALDMDAAAIARAMIESDLPRETSEQSRT